MKQRTGGPTQAKKRDEKNRNVPKPLLVFFVFDVSTALYNIGRWGGVARCCRLFAFMSHQNRWLVGSNDLAPLINVVTK